MNKKESTIDTYNKSARELAGKFDSQGPRRKDIDEIMNMADKKEPHVLEIGCGNGRDAEEIIKFTHFYTGLDISEELLKLAREKIPSANFVFGRHRNFSYSQ